MSVFPAKLSEIEITYLQMAQPPRLKQRSHPHASIAIVHVWKPTISYYRYLYNTVGEPWKWYERRQMGDDELHRIIHDTKVAIYVLSVGGVPAGYVELDSRVKNEVEIAYFGLIPEFIGRGLGNYFLDWSVEKAWIQKPKRVWVHTCNLDHPNALATYQKAGFEPYKRDIQQVIIPEHIL